MNILKLTMLGTGAALVTECYNTCFVIEDDKIYEKRGLMNERRMFSM